MVDDASAREGQREELRRWIERFDRLVDEEGSEAGSRVLAQLSRRARGRDVPVPIAPEAPPFVNTLGPADPARYPGDRDLDARVEALVRWNALAIVARANRRAPGIGGHVASHASAATLLEVGFQHFFRGAGHPEGPDRLFLQGHASPGIYARAFLEGRLDEADLDRFRREVGGGGLSSYPHPRLMPDFWETPTVSMGLGPLMAIYRARFDRYLRARGITDTAPHTWAIVGDGEMDEPESTGALAIASRERLSNLTFVVDCNLQRLDGPVRGNARVISELAKRFAGAGWRVIQVVWSDAMHALLASDHGPRLREVLARTVDGQWQRLAAEGTAALHAHLADGDEALAAAIEEVGPIRRGGHDWPSLTAAFEAARDERDRPVVILAHTVKGSLLGPSAEALNVAHKAKDLDDDARLALRDRLDLDLPDDAARALEYARPGPDAPVTRYLRERRRILGGPRPRRRAREPELDAIDAAPLQDFFGGSEREVTTTAWLVRLLGQLARDEALGPRVVPIVPDEARTFGVEALFDRLGIYRPGGQRYEPVDADVLMTYREEEDGVILEEGITEAGAMGSFIAAGTQHANGGPAMIPFYLFYSMFGLQRVGDLIWAAGDARARGFLIGATSGRTTLNGEGLQHQDGHSHLWAHAIPSLRCYDAAYGYEVAVIVEDGLRRMLVEGAEEIVYLTVSNEPFPMPALPEGAREGIVRGMYPVLRDDDAQVSLLGAGMLLREALRAQELLRRDHGVRADVYAVTSFSELHRDASSAARAARLRPSEAPPTPWVREVLGDRARPVVAVSDWVASLPDLLARWMPGPLSSLGTDGYGRSDTRAALRRHFEVDAEHVAVAALASLAADGSIAPRVVDDAIEAYGIDPRRPDPFTL